MLERPAPGLVPLVERVHQGLRPGRLLAPPPKVSFYPYTGGGSTVREREGRLAFRLSDRLQGAPDQVLEGVVAILLCRILRLPDSRADAAVVRAYRAYLHDERHSTVSALDSSGSPATRTGRKGRKHIEPVGAHRSLLESYLRVSLDLGLTLPRTPTLSWSKTVSRHRFGHWDAEHNAVVISQVLDDPDVPEFVLDYVVYHELLHIIHPARMGSATKRIVHSAAFKRDERRFPKWKEGDEWIRKLARRRGR